LKKRNLVLILLVVIGIVTFLDRINISVAGSSIMHDLGLSKKQWGWVLSSFIFSYGLLQIPLGLWGDKKGQRKVLAVIVLWWSVFTGLTGMGGGFISLLLIRFAFGVGEAGAYPCMTGAIGRWFPKSENAKAQGFIWAASRVGGSAYAIYCDTGHHAFRLANGFLHTGFGRIFMGDCMVLLVQRRSRYDEGNSTK